MAYQLIYTNSFKKDLRLAKKRNYDMKKMEEVLTLLKSGKKLPRKYKDHQLKGNFSMEMFFLCYINRMYLITRFKHKESLLYENQAK